MFTLPGQIGGYIGVLVIRLFLDGGPAIAAAFIVLITGLLLGGLHLLRVYLAFRRVDRSLDRLV